MLSEEDKESFRFAAFRCSIASLCYDVLLNLLNTDLLFLNFALHCCSLAIRHGSTQQLGEEQRDNTTQLLLVPLLGTQQSTPTNVHLGLVAQHLKPTVG